MFDLNLRETKSYFFRPLIQNCKLSANQVTVLGLLAGIAAVWTASQGKSWWSLTWWLINRTLDGLDGEIARHQGQQSDLGGYYDIMADLFIYASLPFALTWHLARPTLWPWLAFLLGSFYLNIGSWMYLSALKEKRNRGASSRNEPTSINMPAGLIEGTETIILYTLFLLLPNRLEELFLLMSVLTCVNVVTRLTWATRNL